MKNTSAYLMSTYRLGADASDPEGNSQPPIHVSPKWEWEFVLKSVSACNAFDYIKVTRGRYYNGSLARVVS